MSRPATFIQRWPDIIRRWPIGKKIRTKVTVMAFLWAQGGLVGYILHLLVFHRNSSQPLTFFFRDLLANQMDVLVYIGCGTMIFMTLMGYICGRMIELLEHQNNELRDLNALKDKFVATCTHDLQNPLNNIMGFAQVIQTMEDASSDVKEFAKIIEKSGAHLTDLVRDILDLAKIGSTFSFESEPINLAEFVRNHCEQQKSLAAKKNIDIGFTALSECGPILANKMSLGRILNNLLSNAVKFTPQGGSVRVTVAPGMVPQSIILSVEDTGIGIPPNKLNALFDTFTKASRQGTDGERSTGLGLAIVKELVAQLKGTIAVKSIEGRGTQFTVTFPEYFVETDGPRQAPLENAA